MLEHNPNARYDVHPDVPPEATPEGPEGKEGKRASEEQVQVFREFDAKCAELAYRLTSSRMYDEEAVVPGFGQRDWEKSRWQELLKEAETLVPAEDVQELLKSHFVEFLSGKISSVDSAYHHPARFIRTQTQFVDRLFRQDSRSPGERYRVFKKRFHQFDDVFRGVKSILGSAEPEKRRQVAVACAVMRKVASKLADEVPVYFPGLSDYETQDLRDMLRRLASKTVGWESEVTRSRFAPREKPRDDGEVLAGASEDERRAAYERVLREELGVELEELLRWHESEIERTRAEMLESAARLDGSVRTPGDVAALLLRVAGPADSVEEMFRRMEEYVAVAKKAAVDGYVDLPEETCLVKPTPEQTRDDYPWGGYAGGCYRRRPLVGECFLNDTNFRAVTDGWLKMMAIHECYPGHHVQFVRSVLDPLPATVALGARSVPLTEGAAHRSEKLLEGIFPDPAFPVFVRLRRHHTAVRIKADLYLHYFGRPVEEAVQLYVDELGFDWNTARGQVLYQERNPGYMTAYYYGMKRLEDLQAKYMPDDKEFTRVLFSVGRLSLRSFERFLRLDPEDRREFQTRYSSLLGQR
ncbi:MAG TPA: DUF885 domain-containing protein [Firmicutes bacterium]|nr:DUF885 domain-containing protein [Candidatus Fermentithermobacillaceae bacterium]